MPYAYRVPASGMRMRGWKNTFTTTRTGRNGQAALWQGYLDDAGRRGWYAVGADWFYRTFAVRRCALYTLTECAWHNRTTGHYGPWRPELYALAKRQGGGGRIVGNVEGASPLAIIEPTTLNTANAKRRSAR